MLLRDNEVLEVEERRDPIGGGADCVAGVPSLELHPTLHAGSPQNRVRKVSVLPAPDRL